MLGHVGVDQQKEEASVEELCHEDPIGNPRQFFTSGVVADPRDHCNDGLLQD